MDRYEYKVRADQIKSLIADNEFHEAMKIADTIDWRRVKSVSMLCTVSEIYKINRKYDEAKQVLLIAYERYPTGRTIIYALCEISIRTGDVLGATRYLKEYEAVAPGDPGIFVLRYRFMVLTEAGIEQRIHVLEELKKAEYQEKWAYELAELYSKNGQITECAAECDELVTWFGSGSYVNKALKLKAQYIPLNPEQQYKYNNINGIAQSGMGIEISNPRPSDEPTVEFPRKEIEGGLSEGDISVKPYSLDKYSTINLQDELRRSMVELENETGEPLHEEEVPVEGIDRDSDQFSYEEASEEGEYQYSGESMDTDMRELTAEPEEARYEEPDGSLAEVWYEEPEQYEEPEEPLAPERYAEPEESPAPGQYEEEEPEEPPLQYGDADPVPRNDYYEQRRNYEDSLPQGMPRPTGKKSGFEDLVREEYDGQMVLEVPDEPDALEKQITGQLDFQDILESWNRKREENNRKRIEDAKRKSLEQTNDIVNQLSGVIPGIKVRTAPEPVRVPVTAQAAVMPEIGVSGDDKPEQEDGVSEKAEGQETQRSTPRGAKIIADDNLTMLSPEGGASNIRFEEVEEPPEEVRYEEDYPVDYPEDNGEDTQEEYPEEEKWPEEEYPEEDYPGEEFPGEEYPEEEEPPKTDERHEEVKAPERRLPEYSEADDGELVIERPAGKYIPPEPPKVEGLTSSEEEIFAAFLQMHDMPELIKDAKRRISMTGHSGNVIVTGNEKQARIDLCAALAQDMQLMNPGFIGKIAKIGAGTFNRKDIARSITALDGGALVIENAGELTDTSLKTIVSVLKKPTTNIVVMLEDTYFYPENVRGKIPDFEDVFSIHVKIPSYTNDDLVFHAREYAREQEYTIDDMGILALYTRIDRMQTADHFVSIKEVEQIVDDAIRNVDKKTPGHFMDVLLAKRYDSDDYIILREKDFNVRYKGKK
ncbi:MAG: hypothetical protein K5985_07570 [Lachnospiraceae bacterium]|nr:hypothetical protein [Lachnospiraceae bacterium]